MKNELRLIISGVIIAVFTSCEYTPIVPNDTPDVGDVSFVDDVEPIFTDAGCTSCHNGGVQKPDLRNGYAYASIMSNADLTDYAYAQNIYDYPKPSGAHDTRYKSDEQAAIVKAWIDQGTQDN